MPSYHGNKDLWQLYQNNSDVINTTQYMEAAERIGQRLIDHAVKTQNGWVWNLIFDDKPDWYSESSMWPLYFFGWGYGVAGIGNFLLALYQQTNKIDYLFAAQKAADYLINSGINETENSVEMIRWTQYENGTKTYFGYQLGSAGILDFLLELYKLDKNATYREAITAGLAYLLKTKLLINASCVTWTFGANVSDSSSGWLNGVTGIGRVFLKAYSILGRTEYVTAVENLACGLLALTTQLEQGIPYSQENNSLMYIGDYYGVAGIVGFFVEMFRVLGDLKWLTYAESLAEYLISQEKNGYWKDTGTLNLLSKKVEPTNVIALNLAEGSPGVALQLLNLFLELPEHKEYIRIFRHVVEFLIEHAVNIDEEKVKWPRGVDVQEYYSGFSLGAAGIGYFFAVATKYFPIAGFIQYLNKTTNWLLSIEKNGTYPVKESFEDDLFAYGHHSGFMIGSAGVGWFFLKTVELLKNYRPYFDEDTYYKLSREAPSLVDFLLSPEMLFIGVLALVIFGLSFRVGYRSVKEAQKSKERYLNIQRFQKKSRKRRKKRK